MEASSSSSSSQAAFSQEHSLGLQRSDSIASVSSLLVEDSGAATVSTQPRHPDLVLVAQRSYVKWESAKESAFYGWWKTTPYHRNLESGAPSHFDPRWNSSSRVSTAWLRFHPVAHCDTGRPKVQCKACSALLEHPTHRSIGTSCMTKHTASLACRRRSGDSMQQTSLQVTSRVGGLL